MIEFAIVAPVLFALVFGVFDFGRAMSANVTITNSTREAARYSATHTVSGPVGTVSGYKARFGFECPTGSPLNIPDAGPTQAAWVQAQAANLDLSQISIRVSYYSSSNDPANGGEANDTQWCTTDGSGNPQANESNTGYSPQSGDWVRVEIKYNYAPATPVISSLFSSIKLDQTATMVLE